MLCASDQFVPLKLIKYLNDIRRWYDFFIVVLIFIIKMRIES